MQINVLDYLEKSARIFPDKPSIIDGEGKITFSELKVAAMSIGSTILDTTSQIIRRPIIVLVDRSAAPIIGFMGALYSGNYYVPVDINTPKARIQKIIDTLDPLAIILEDKYDFVIEGLNHVPVIVNKEIAENQPINYKALENVRNKIIDVDPAYIIYTSGSTGTPKGIVVSHKGIVDLTEWLHDTFPFTDNDILGNQTPFYFDASVKDIYIALKEGATLCIIPKNMFMFPVKIIDYLNKYKITTILWATSAITLLAKCKVLDKKRPEYLNKIFFAGETMYASNLNVWRKHLKDVLYVNLYGPTETTVDATYYIVNRDFKDDEFIPIGRACKNMEILLLDKDRMLVSDGEIGEICIRGTGVALGYYNDVEKSDEVFIQNPMNKLYEDKIYCTGDIGKKNEFGEILFISRKDNQIKHMGYRIELGEIEVAINAISRIKEAICFYNKEAMKIVLIYVGDVDNKEIINYLNKKLPKYMFPNEIIKMDSFLYNANGKINRKVIMENYFNDKNK